MRQFLFLILILFFPKILFAHDSPEEALALADAKAGKICLEYQEYDVTECENTHVKNGVTGGLLGAAGGYLFGGSKGAWLGALGGGAVGAASGSKKCVTRHEKECVKWKVSTLREYKRE